jgi:hypothetical protein
MADWQCSDSKPRGPSLFTEVKHFGGEAETSGGNRHVEQTDGKPETAEIVAMVCSGSSALAWSEKSREERFRHEHGRPQGAGFSA